eukprot:5013255-Amphidinium_carterae.1
MLHTNTVQDTTKVFKQIKEKTLADTILLNFPVFWCIPVLLKLSVYLLFCMVSVVVIVSLWKGFGAWSSTLWVVLRVSEFNASHVQGARRKYLQNKGHQPGFLSEVALFQKAWLPHSSDLLSLFFITSDLNRSGM